MAKSASSKHPAHYTRLCDLLREAASIGAVGALLGWDQETYMPHAGAAMPGGRADQSSIISGIVHERRTSKEIGDLIARCEGDRNLLGDSRIAANVREMRRDYDLATKLPTSLVSELARTGSLSQDAWKDARAKNRFKDFKPWLEKMLDLTRQKAKCYGVPKGGEVYDALLDEYEPGMTAREVEGIFTPLRGRLAGLVSEIVASKAKVSDKCTEIGASQADQHAFGHDVIKALGFDLNAGRLDTTAHPFCSGMGPGDTRLTTRYGKPSILEALGSTMHEAGHGMYEQGLPKATHFGQPLADAISLGIHESQSRMWENLVGRSRAFWQWALPVAKKRFGAKLAKVNVDQMYAAANVVQPSFIRVEADEATYNLHIMIRFAIERALISEDLSVSDLPGTWNAMYKEYLGLKVPSDTLGCLQDVHWSFGLIGYFPTYTLGNLYAAQFWVQISRDIPDLDKRMAKGDFAPLLAWLRKNIHQHGRRYRAAELCQRVTGRPLSADPLMAYLEGKLRPIYGLDGGAKAGAKAASKPAHRARAMAMA